MRAASSNRGWLRQAAVWGHMLGKTVLPGDEELGKKDDDHKPGAAPRIPLCAFLSAPRRWRRRRILLAVAALYLLYLFVRNIPDLGEANGRRPGYGSGRPIVPMTNDDYNQAYDAEPSGAPPGTKAPKAGQPAPQTYAGPIKFYRLASSLHAASHTGGYHYTNRNVLFAMSGLKSASALLPMACEMARWSRSYVHAAFMGRQDIPLADLLEINGIDKVKCPAIWHDARADFTEYSTDARHESSVMAALGHIHSFLHPQVAIVDGGGSEDFSFARGMRARTKALGMPLVEIPKDGWESLMWATRLDAGSLHSWHLPSVDIIIQVPPESSSVIGLLKSIRTADYSGFQAPRLTIELPAEMDDSVKQYLENFKWPLHDRPTGNHVSIRRRIANQRATQEESAVRFLELFYPTSTTNSHVLLLSPQTQLSAQYYQYLMYTLLEYRYSSFGEDDSANLMGVSLELPSVLPDGKTKLKPPKPADMHTSRYQELFPETPSTQFLWQAPNSHATLFFGDKWAELHSYLSNRVAKHYQSPKAAARRKLVSETLPSWTEYMLEFMRARGYSLFYPGKTSSESLVTVHNELYHAPEEFLPRTTSAPGGGEMAPPRLPDEPFLRGEEAAPRPTNVEAPVLGHSRPLHVALPFEGDLPEIAHLPYLLHSGRMVPHANVSSIAAAYADRFREVIGGCKMPAGKHRRVLPGSARDLFCFGDEDEKEWEDDAVETFAADVVDDYRASMDKGEASPAPSVRSRTMQRTVAAPTTAIEG
ncbi:hypothetical protein BU26DRAFT_525615 [Trematosphaeria pertusa]|uniref:Uncharacterized protein n=1 Tax=Trematosphaeria pertusa TaxID=390896 RepID=A0A6A6HTI5_9PLEO|nr:uncharacterized protein BU26DRAFT_525615 [Trematosphaeria pertusa]KAF2241092.1 hypothetical protein BU26DRAFT_525615 [Trematosphaeria pertusa]